MMPLACRFARGAATIWILSSFSVLQNETVVALRKCSKHPSGDSVSSSRLHRFRAVVVDKNRLKDQWRLILSQDLSLVPLGLLHLDVPLPDDRFALRRS